MGLRVLALALVNPSARFGFKVVGDEEEADADDGRNEMESVPEKRTTETVSATGRMAVRGRG